VKKNEKKSDNLRGDFFDSDTVHRTTYELLKSKPWNTLQCDWPGAIDHGCTGCIVLPAACMQRDYSFSRAFPNSRMRVPAKIMSRWG